MLEAQRKTHTGAAAEESDPFLSFPPMLYDMI